MFQRLTPSQLLLLGFIFLIAVGTTGFLLLPGLHVGPRLGFVDALFTATSAVCVTGLIVVDTATRFTPLGQAWILALIQAGGLGILTFTTMTLMALGRRMPLGLEEASGGHAHLLGHLSPRRLVVGIVAVTLVLEGMGATLLYLLWRGRPDLEGALWPAVFHAVSAFCNAGFSTFSDSLEGFSGSPGTLLVVAGLVVLGGLGFLVLEDVRARLATGSARRLSLHSRMVLVATGALLAGGWLLFLAFEWNHTLAGMDWMDRVAGAGFMSVTPRTAGFNTVDYTEVSNASLFLTILLMLVGGSPGSTAGGFKTVTVMLLFLLFLSRMRGESRVSAWSRTVPSETVQRAGGLVIGGLVLLGGSVFLLLIIESVGPDPVGRAAFVSLVFEAHSAFGTVGLSVGATPDLTPAGRVVVTALMFLGRVGPPVVIAGMVRAFRTPGPEYRYGEEDVLLG